MADELNTKTAKTPAEEMNSAERTRAGTVYRPNVDIVETQDELLVLADIPGGCGDDIDVNFEEGMLTMHAKVARRQPEDTEYLLREYGVGDYYRTFRVSEAIDASKIYAEFADGVLTLHLPKADAAKPRKIQVRA
jgi:HSP20 family protein